MRSLTRITWLQRRARLGLTAEDAEDFAEAKEEKVEAVHLRLRVHVPLQELPGCKRATDLELPHSRHKDQTLLV